MSVQEIEPDPEPPLPPRSLGRRIRSASAFVIAPVAIVAAVIFIRWIVMNGGPQDALTMLWALPVTAVASSLVAMTVSEATSRPTYGTSGGIGVAAIWLVGKALVLVGALLATLVMHLSGGDGYGAIYGWSTALHVALDALLILVLI